MVKNEFLKDLCLHSMGVCGLAMSIGRAMGISLKELQLLEKSAMSHDIGKGQIDNNILFKPGKLTKEEFEIVKRHVCYGVYILTKSGDELSKECCDFVLYHHENYDGSGYFGLKGEEIPLISRIIRIADTYNALIEDRCCELPTTEVVGF